jgi:NAD+ synthase (glutamine-hydrolysing)
MMKMQTDADFLDIREHGFARVAVCVPEGRVADPNFNAEAHLASLEEVAGRGAHYALCPELGISSYSCGDLFFQDVLLRESIRGLERLANATAAMNMLISVGVPLALGGSLFNCAVTLYRGRPLAVTPKSYPPNYREFYELRWFHPGRDASADTIDVLGQTVPFGTDVLVRARHLCGFVLFTDICEDLWVPVPPSSLAALGGATILGNLSASNITVAKWEYRQDLVVSSSARNLAVQMYSAAGFGESTAELAWDGHGLIAERGRLLAETDRFSVSGASVVADVDLRTLQQDRMRQTSFGGNAGDHARRFRTVECGEERETRATAVFHELHRDVDAHPFVPSDAGQRDQRCREVFLIQATSLARRLAALPEEGRRVVVGVSGGQDSTHALLVAAYTMDLLKLERQRVVAVTMPGLGTTERTRNNASKLSEALHVQLFEIPIGALSESIFAAIGHPPEVEDLTFENVQAWLRKLLLFSMASRHQGIDLGTGDLSELALGWCTYGGDHISHYGVNSGVPKTLISYLIGWVADVIFADDAGVQGVLRDVLDTPISPELRRPGDDGEIIQHSEDVVGPYELHDFFLYHFLRFGEDPRRVARICLHAWGDRYDIAEIRRWLLVFLERFFANQFKRDCVPDGPKVGSGGSLSPRGDWRMPSDASAELWIADAQSIPEKL